MKLDVKVTPAASGVPSEVVFTINGVPRSREDFITCALAEIAARLPSKPKLGPWRTSADGDRGLAPSAFRMRLSDNHEGVIVTGRAWRVFPQLIDLREPMSRGPHGTASSLEDARAQADACAAEWYDLGEESR